MAAEDRGPSNAGFEGVLQRVNTTSSLEQLQAEMNNLNQFAMSEDKLVAPLDASEKMWISAGQAADTASTRLSNYSRDLLTTWRSDGDSELFAAASERSTTSLRQAQGVMAGGEGTSGISTMVRELAGFIRATTRYNQSAVDRLTPLLEEARTHVIQMRAGVYGAKTEEQIRQQELTYLNDLRPGVQRMGESLQTLNSTYETMGPQISSAASGLKWEGPGAGNTIPTGGPGGPGGGPGGAGPGAAGPGAPVGAPAGDPAAPTGDPALASADGPTGAPGGPNAPVGAPTGGPNAPVGGPQGGPNAPVGGPGGTELSRLSPGGIPTVPTPPGGTPGLTPPGLPNGGLPLPPTGLAVPPPIGAVGNGPGSLSNRPRVPGSTPLPPLNKGGLGTIGAGGLGGSGISGAGGGAGLGNLGGGGGAGPGKLGGGAGELGLGKAGGDQMIPRAGEQPVAPNQAGTGRAPTGSGSPFGPGSPFGTTAAGAAPAGGTPGGAPPMMPPMGGAGAAGGGGRGGKPGAGAIRPVNRKRKGQDDDTPGVPLGLRGKAGRDLPGGFPMVPMNNRRRKDERDQPVDTIELLDEELWKVEEAEAVETKKRVGRLAT